MLGQIPRQVRRADNLAAVVQPIRLNDCAYQSAQVQHRPVFPKERIEGWKPRRRIYCRVGERPPGDLSALVDQEGSAVGSTESPQIQHALRFGPAKRVRLGRSWDIEKARAGVRVGNSIQGYSGHLAPVVDGVRYALVSTQRPQIGDGNQSIA